MSHIMLVKAALACIAKEGMRVEEGRLRESCETALEGSAFRTEGGEKGGAEWGWFFSLFLVPSLHLPTHTHSLSLPGVDLVSDVIFHIIGHLCTNDKVTLSSSSKALRGYVRHCRSWEALDMRRLGKLKSAAFAKAINRPSFALVRDLTLPSVSMSEKLFPSLFAAAPRVQRLDLSNLSGKVKNTPKSLGTLIASVPDPGQIKSLKFPWGLEDFTQCLETFSSLESLDMTFMEFFESVPSTAINRIQSLLSLRTLRLRSILHKWDGEDKGVVTDGGIR